MLHCSTIKCSTIPQSLFYCSTMITPTVPHCLFHCSTIIVPLFHHKMYYLLDVPLFRHQMFHCSTIGGSTVPWWLFHCSIIRCSTLPASDVLLFHHLCSTVPPTVMYYFTIRRSTGNPFVFFFNFSFIFLLHKHYYIYTNKLLQVHKIHFLLYINNGLYKDCLGTITTIK